MATITIGTAATTTLVGLAQNANALAADIATIAEHIYDDAITAGVNQIYPGAYSRFGPLYVPNRGVLRVLPGDIVAYDAATGWPILVSARAAAGAGWVHS